MLPFLFFFCYVYRNSFATNRNPQWSLQKYLSFFVSFCSKKVSFVLKLRFVSRKICSTRNGKRSFRTKGSASLIFSFLNVIILRAHCIYMKQLCAASATSSCIVTTADASAGGNNSCTYLFLFLSLFFYSPFFLLSLSLSYSPIHPTSCALPISNNRSYRHMFAIRIASNKSGLYKFLRFIELQSNLSSWESEYIFYFHEATATSDNKRYTAQTIDLLRPF